MNKSGFTSLYIVIILASLIFLLLVVIEAAAGYAIGSVGESLCMISGESVLSEYQRSLWQRYGVFALKSSDERLTEMSKFYILKGLNSEESSLLCAELSSCLATSEKYPGLDVEAFSVQIRQMAMLILAKEAMTGKDFSDAYDQAVDAQESVGPMQDQSLQSLENLTAISTPEEQPESQEIEAEEIKTKRQAESLLRRFASITGEQNADPSLERAITDAGIRADLPSAWMGIGQNERLLFKKKEIDVRSIPENEYILNRCSLATSQRENTFLALEAEYILYGKFSDKENEKEIKSSLFWLRSALNISCIYSDHDMLSQASAMAGSLFSMIPLPLAVFMISSIWAAVEAKQDVALIMRGDAVPFIKGQSDWHYSLNGAFSEGPMGVSLSSSSSKTGKYDDYLRLFLLTLPREEKLVRLMDIMQLNIAVLGNENFSFRDYAYGFTLYATFQKKIHVFGNGFNSYRNGTIVQDHEY